jgi:hypothetical protein
LFVAKSRLERRLQPKLAALQDTIEDRMAIAKQSKIPAEKLELYEKLIATNPEIKRKGDVHPYTSQNGHMFTYLDQTGTLGIRLPQVELDAFVKKYKSPPFVSYGTVKKDWATVPDALLKKTKELKKYLNISYEYVKTLKPK